MASPATIKLIRSMPEARELVKLSQEVGLSGMSLVAARVCRKYLEAGGRVA